jgi:hypothetical protein
MRIGVIRTSPSGDRRSAGGRVQITAIGIAAGNDATEPDFGHTNRAAAECEFGHTNRATALPGAGNDAAGRDFGHTIRTGTLPVLAAWKPIP